MSPARADATRALDGRRRAERAARRRAAVLGLVRLRLARLPGLLLEASAKEPVARQGRAPSSLNRISHDCIGHNHIVHNYMGHTYMGHKVYRPIAFPFESDQP